MLKIRVLTAALLSVMILALPGCGSNQSRVQTKTTPEISQASTASSGFSEQTDMTMPAAGTSAAPEHVETAMSATKETSAAPTPAPVTAADIAALPAGSIVGEFLQSEEIVNACFYYEEISDVVFARMDGKSYGEDCTIPLSDLRYVRVLYYGFDDSVHIGELVVNTKIAEDIVEVFRVLYDARYLIGKMVLVDEYDADDNASMLDNNTSAFNYRTVNGTSTLSRHALGLAIDINPLYNPWIYRQDGKTVIDPPEAAQYADRTLDCEYYLDHEDLCYKLLTGHGFTWGGDWDSSKDYQHFSKSF